MTFKANVNVFYKGFFHAVGETFEIEDTDAEEMKQYGSAEEVKAAPARKKKA